MRGYGKRLQTEAEAALAIARLEDELGIKPLWRIMAEAAADVGPPPEPSAVGKPVLEQAEAMREREVSDD